MLKNSSVSIIAMLAAFAMPTGAAYAQGGAPNLSGTYRCIPEPDQCQAPTFSVSQTGTTLEIQAANGPVARGKVTSNVSLSSGPPWNDNGTVLPDGSIQWSNGTHWRKQ